MTLRKRVIDWLFDVLAPYWPDALKIGGSGQDYQTKYYVHARNTDPQSEADDVRLPYYAESETHAMEKFYQEHGRQDWYVYSVQRA